MIELKDQKLLESLVEKIKESSSKMQYNFNTEANRVAYTEDILKLTNDILSNQRAIIVTDEDGIEKIVGNPKVTYNDEESNESKLCFRLEGELIDSTNFKSKLFDINLK